MKISFNNMGKDGSKFCVEGEVKKTVVSYINGLEIEISPLVDTEENEGKSITLFLNMEDVSFLLDELLASKNIAPIRHQRGLRSLNQLFWHEEE
jgi:hypothetical protein